MASLAFVNGLSQKLSLLRGDQRGTAAIEFAAVGMTMVILWVGCAEVVAGVAQQRRVTLAARTVADLTTRFENLNNADKVAVRGATHVILQTTLEGPYKVTLSVVNIDADGVAKVGWREVRGNGKGAEGPDSGS